MNETRQLIEETAQRIFKDLCTQETVNGVEEGQWPAELWNALEESGLTVAGIPDDLGGAGGELGDSLAVIKWAGRFAAPIPITETFLAAWMLSLAGMSVPQGPLTVSTSTAHELSLTAAESGWRLSGSVDDVPWPEQAASLVALIPEGSGHRVCLIGLEAGQKELGGNMAGEPVGRVTFEDAPLAPELSAKAPPELSPEAVLEMGALCRSIQMASALHSVLALTIEHANVRVQFGRPIGSFQAIRQQIAVLATQLAAASRASQVAADAIESGAAPAEIAIAKARTGEAATLGAEIAHQVHGAMGMTYEHTLHHFTRRIWSWRDDFGAERYWQRILGQQAFGEGPGELWRFVSSV